MQVQASERSVSGGRSLAIIIAAILTASQEMMNVLLVEKNRIILSLPSSNNSKKEMNWVLGHICAHIG